ncbi:hypothetical protein SKAU_G00002150 [Synaphobranchus kaupii]|uniref:Uncharacterized protein n=1 Tax=Synaphobranchus kaupii TaxID=118154 RepID=A0A9Q1JCJ1_SYNKA|nr:hypothetical protein SKAU_G00002150 [Synaphobranchus kaupii]
MDIATLGDPGTARCAAPRRPTRGLTPGAAGGKDTSITQGPQAHVNAAGYSFSETELRELASLFLSL